jgi:hypothetical protein
MISIFPIELIWYIDFFTQITTGSNIFGVTTYMFDPQYNMFLRGLSFFHLVIPAIWIWYLYKWGYDKRAIVWATILNWIVLITTYLCTNPAYNINWVFMPYKYQWNISPIIWLACMMIGFPLFIIMPMHYILLLLDKNTKKSPQ